MKKPARRRLSAFICLFILLPIIPFGLLEAALRHSADFINWLFDDRWLARSLVKYTERVERHFGVDQDTLYREWQERIRAQRKRA